MYYRNDPSEYSLRLGGIAWIYVGSTSSDLLWVWLGMVCGERTCQAFIYFINSGPVRRMYWCILWQLCISCF